ncbi:MAG TPA: hypothetical protein VHO70_10340 [Chitinispirillaceae bacterium]|nr:hypothetical protein [Chitinispirillaceae bacterium]
MEKSCKKILFLVVSILLFSTTVAVVKLFSGIETSVKTTCCNAQAQYPGKTKVEALIEVLKSDTQSLDAKNDAIYALGYVRDTSALPVLRSLKTGARCDHKRYVCQRQLERTIRCIEGREKSIFNFR